MTRSVASWRALGLGVLLAALVGCAASSSGLVPGTVYVAGSEPQGALLRSYNAVDLSSRAPLGLPAPVVAAAFDARRQSLDLVLGNGELQPLDTRTQRLGTPIVLGLENGSTPTAIALDAGQHWAYVLASAGGARGWLLAVNLDLGKVEARARVGRDPVGLGLGADGKRLLVANAGDPSVSLIAAAGLRPLATTPLTSPPRQVIGVPFGSEAFVLCGATVAAMELQSGRLLTYLPLGSEPQSMALKPDGGELYVSNAGGTVSVVDTNTDVVSGTIAAGAGAGGMAVAPDGSTLYVGNAAAGTVSVINLDDRSTATVVRVGEQPRWLELGPGGLYLFVVDTGSGDLAVVRSSEDPDNPNTLVTLLPSPPAASALAVAANPGRS